MPKNKAYNRMNIKSGGTRTPKSVQGSQGTSVNDKVSKPMVNKTRPTKRTKFPG